MKKYTILRGIEKGNRFFCLTGNETPEDIVKLADGTVAYEIIGDGDTVAECQIKLYGRAFTTSKD